MKVSYNTIEIVLKTVTEERNEDYDVVSKETTTSTQSFDLGRCHLCHETLEEKFAKLTESLYKQRKGIPKDKNNVVITFSPGINAWGNITDWHIDIIENIQLDKLNKIKQL
jgi:hypothetical protein